MRLLKAPSALVVVLALLVLPSVYSWYNIAGFWDPYGNTGALKVCVVNQDEGGNSELTGDLDIGTRIVDTLEENTQLDWQFCDYDTAMDMLYSGQAYAVYMIPSTFTEDLLTIVTGELHQPNIVYYVNEKLAPVAPKITDTGATTLDETINSTFVSTVADVVVETLDDSIDSANQKLTDANSQVLEKLEGAKVTIADMKTSLQNAQDKAATGSNKIQSTKSALQNVDTELDTAASQLQTLATRGTDLQNTIADIAGSLNGTLIDTDALKEAIQGANGIEVAADKAAAAIQITQTLNTQSIDLMDQLDDILGTSTSATAETLNLLDKMDAQLDTLIIDCRALSTSGITDIINQSSAANNNDGEGTVTESLDAEKISNFMASPTTIVTEQLYYINAYGSAMAPLFMNLTFWIGAFMLLVIMKQEVDSEGITRPTAKQRYVARFLLFAILVILQSAICCVGVRALGVEVANTSALFLAAACSSLTYLAIIYALSTTLQHIGKGICLVLVFAQIPGATGLYPIEMTSPFFQAVYPLLPFTYGIGAMREAICGFYGSQFIQNIGILATFGVAFFIGGLLLKPVMANVNKVVADQIAESDIINGESSENPTRPYRLSQIVRALTARAAYRQSILKRHDRFERIYPKIRRGSMIVGVIMPIALGIALAVTPTERVTLITICLIWMIAFFIFLTVVESLRASLNRHLELDTFNDNELKELYNIEKGSRNA